MVGKLLQIIIILLMFDKSKLTALKPYLHVRFEITATFSTVLHAHLMYKSIAKDCKKICMALF